MVFGFNGKKSKEETDAMSSLDNESLDKMGTVSGISHSRSDDMSASVSSDMASEKNTLFSESIFSRSKITFNTNSSSVMSDQRSSKNKRSTGLSSLLSTGASFALSRDNQSGLSSSRKRGGLGLSNKGTLKNNTGSSISSSSSSAIETGQDDDTFENSGNNKQQQQKNNTVGKPLRVNGPALDFIEEDDDSSLHKTENKKSTVPHGFTTGGLFNVATTINTDLTNPRVQSNVTHYNLANPTTGKDLEYDKAAAGLVMTSTAAKPFLENDLPMIAGGDLNHSTNSTASQLGVPFVSSQQEYTETADQNNKHHQDTKNTPMLHQRQNTKQQTKHMHSLNFDSHKHSVKVSTPDFVEKELRILDENLITVIDDIHQNVINISRAAIQAIEFFKRFLTLDHGQKFPYKVKTSKNSSLRSIIKTVLHFNDNLLVSDVYQTSKAILMSKFIEFLKKLNIEFDDEDQMSPNLTESKNLTLPTLKIFALDDSCTLPNKDKISKIIKKITETDPGIVSDQNGAFIAPLIRGISLKSSILTVMFGVPNLQQEHFEMIKALYSTFPDVHFYCVKDMIKACSSTSASKTNIPLKNAQKSDYISHGAGAMVDLLSGPPMMGKQFLPQNTLFPTYRLPADYSNPPISLSLSTADSQKISGTLGGYLYPKINSDDEKLKQFEGSTFAITCAHVVLFENQDYPYVSVPSTVLQMNYKKKLIEASSNYSEKSKQKIAYNEEIKKVDDTINWQKENYFGQVVWGERSIINKKLSDFAIIKLNNSCVNITSGNYLGDDLAQYIPDPSLRFDNLYVTEKVLNFTSGTEVFKYGSTTGYTRGKTNGSKLVFWADGKIQTSEFVVASSSAPLFATGGDSGAWILSRLGKNKLGLGVLGMLHSYDGELKQFGLFTPIGDILDRLKAVTGVEWDLKQFA